MANILTTWLFELTTISGKGDTAQPARETGWTESLVSTAATELDQQLIKNANDYAKNRMPLLAAQGKCIGYRFHNMTTNATRAYPLTYPWKGTGTDCTMPQIAFLCRLWAKDTNNNRALELRGVPSSFVITGEIDPGMINPRIRSTFFNFIVANYGMMGVGKSWPHFKVDDVSSSGTVKLKEDQTGIAVNDWVKFYRTKFDDTCCGSVGLYKVLTVGTDTMTLKDFPTDRGNAHGGKVGKWTAPTFLAFDNTATDSIANGWEVQRSVIRKSGRPFDLFSGRRSRNCCQC